MRKQIVLITGASSGIGKACSLLFLNKGYKVYASAPNIDSMNDLKSKGAITIKLDVADSINCRQVVDLIMAKSGSIDILVNNAGYGLYGAVEDVPISEAKHQFEVNLFGLMELTQLVLPEMRKNKNGRIINISSILGLFTLPMGGWYHASKYALEGISDSLRQEVHSFGIKVILINPGAIESNWSRTALKNAKEHSSQSEYRFLTSKLNSWIKKSTQIQSKPEKVARIIVKASEAKRPKARYIVTRHAKFSIFTLNFFGERIFNSGKKATLKFILNQKDSS